MQKWRHAEDEDWGPSPSLNAFGATSTWSWAQKCKCLTRLLCLTNCMGVKLGTWRTHIRNNWKWCTSTTSEGFWAWRSRTDTASLTSERFAKPSHWPCCLGSIGWNATILSTILQPLWKGTFWQLAYQFMVGSGMSRCRTKFFGTQWCRDSNSSLKRQR
jgi:hypothetical protein